jgi:dihydrofolate synthase/folylpolyglutamate synthase
MIDGRPLSDADWLGVYRELQPVIDELELTFFEATTLMAFEIFRREKVAWAVFETGLGGRLDATNIVVPRVAVISRIAMDHCEYLGPDLPSVAREKLGIVKKKAPLVMAEPAEEGVRAMAEARCREMETVCIFAGLSAATNVIGDAGGTAFEWEGRPYRVNLRGDYQPGNAVVALQALKTAGFSDNERIAAGLERAKLPGRFQVESIRGKTVVFDVGHNPDAAAAFSGAMKKRFSGKSVCLVTGIMKDKDRAGILVNYCRMADRIILTRPATDRAAAPEELKEK